MSSPDTADLAAKVAQDMLAYTTELKLAGTRFAVDDPSYRQGYDKIKNLYGEVHAARVDLERQAPAIERQEVSTQIAGLRDGAERAQRALVGENGGSLLNVLRSVEAQISLLLNDMYKGYVTYQQTDQEAAFNLVGAAEPR